MTKRLYTRQGHERWLFEHEFEVRHALKSIHKAHTFSVDGIKATQLRHTASLKAAGVDPTSDILQPNWNTIDDRRASAACAFEQFRARAWALGELYASLASTFQQLWLVTFVDTSDRRTEGNLRSFNLTTYKRRVNSALANLKRASPDLWAFGVVEISATRTPDKALIFEPHCHLLVGNASDIEVRASFGGVLKLKSTAHRPVQLKTVSTNSDLARMLGYFFKLVPELRTKIQGDIGRSIEGHTNHLRGDPETEWLAWMAAHHVRESLIGMGHPAKMIRQFDACELQAIIENLLHRHRKRPV